MRFQQVRRLGNGDHESGYIRLRNGFIELLQSHGADASSWEQVYLLEAHLIPLDGWSRASAERIDNVVRLDPYAVTYSNHVFTPHGMRVAAEYCRSWLLGVRRVEIELRYPDLAGCFYEFRMCDELCRDQAEYEDAATTTTPAMDYVSMARTT